MAFATEKHPWHHKMNSEVITQGHEKRAGCYNIDRKWHGVTKKAGHCAWQKWPLPHVNKNIN